MSNITFFIDNKRNKGGWNLTITDIKEEFIDEVEEFALMGDYDKAIKKQFGKEWFIAMTTDNDADEEVSAEELGIKPF